MKKTIASLLLGTALSLASASFALAQDKTVKIGALSDQSGLYADLGGPGSTLAAQMAVEDWLKRRVVRSSEPLLPGQRIRLILLNQANDTIKAVAVTLAAGLSNAVLRE